MVKAGCVSTCNADRMRDRFFEGTLARGCFEARRFTTYRSEQR